MTIADSILRFFIWEYFLSFSLCLSCAHAHIIHKNSLPTNSIKFSAINFQFNLSLSLFNLFSSFDFFLNYFFVSSSFRFDPHFAVFFPHIWRNDKNTVEKCFFFLNGLRDIWIQRNKLADMKWEFHQINKQKNLMSSSLKLIDVLTMLMINRNNKSILTSENDIDDINERFRRRTKIYFVYCLMNCCCALLSR